MASDGEKSKKSLPSDNAKASAIREDGAFWSIFAYLISGLVFWGAMGALGDHFLHTGCLTAHGSKSHFVVLRTLPATPKLGLAGAVRPPI